MNLKKKIVGFLLAVCMVVSLLPTNSIAVDVVAAGSCGDNVTWTVYNDGSMVIEGTGDMYDYDSDEGVLAPWRNVTGVQVDSVTVQGGVTSVGKNAFAHCDALLFVYLREGVTTVRDAAFFSCAHLTGIAFPSTLTSIGSEAFNECNELTTVCYTAGESEWTNIAIDFWNAPLQNASTMLFYYDASEQIFEDVEPMQYYAPAIAWAFQNGFTTGKTETTFAPEETCTRAEVATFLWRVMGSPEPKSTETAFIDLSSDAYYYNAVLWAAEQGITNGVENDRFAPLETVTRGQFVTFLHRSQGSPAAEQTGAFYDLATGEYYVQPVYWAVENAITNGTGLGTFSPDSECLRGQVVTFLYRALA